MDSITDALVRFADRPAVGHLRVDGHGIPKLRAMAPSLDALVRVGFERIRRDSVNRSSFAARLLELLADLREAAAPAGQRDEIDRQARLIADHAAALAGQQADQRLVTETYDRLHAHLADAVRVRVHEHAWPRRRSVRSASTHPARAGR